jgi:hypothetical protein
MHPLTKRAVSSIKAETPSAISMVMDPDSERILNSEKGGLKANGVQEGSTSSPW